MPAASARWTPRGFSTRPQRVTPWSSASSDVAATRASASARAGTRSGRTKLVSSRSRTPADTSASNTATLASVEIGASSCNPSRRVTSRSTTWRDVAAPRSNDITPSSPVRRTSTTSAEKRQRGLTPLSLLGLITGFRPAAPGSVNIATMEPSPPSRSGPLAGIRVLELGNFIAGPFAGQLFGDYGADVIKIEAPDGDPMRHWGVCLDGESLWWPIISRNKQSVVADLGDAEDLAMLQRLATECDVVLENFRPGVLARYGLDHATLSAVNPGVIVTHVSGFGQTGPRSSEAGFGSIGEAVGGIRHTTGDPDRPPARCGISLGDSLAAMFAVIGTLAALHERSSSGKGQEIDVAIYEAVAALMESSMVDYDVAGVIRNRSGGKLPGVAPANAYPTRDGSEVLIAGNADTVFVRLCEAMGRPGLATDDRYATHAARGAHERELDELVAEWTQTIDSDELLDLLRAHTVPAGRVYTAPDMLTDSHYLAREMVQRHLSRTDVDTPMLGVVPKFSRTPGSIDDVGPSLGEHTDRHR